MMKENYKIYFVLALIPYLVLSPYTFQFLEVGNDFELYFYSYKKYIFELFKLGHLPLWSPVEASGSSLIFNPLTQFFYLPSWILYFLCLLIGDISKYSFLIFTISAISIFNLGLFLFFKTFKIETKVAVTTIIITCISLKINELLRFPNAIHSFAWFSWILYGINLAATSKNFKKSFFVIFFSTLMLLTAGYPYYIFYGFVIFSIYFIFLSIKPFRTKIFFDNQNVINNFKFFVRCAIPSFLSLLVASPWLLKISQLISITHGRNETTINFSLRVSSNFFDQIGSWIYPPFSIAEGWYYFGSISVLIIFLVFLYSVTFNRENFKNNYPIKLFSFLFIFLIIFSYQISNPTDSLIFSLMWENINMIQNFRHFIRFNVVLVPFLSLLLAYSIIEFVKLYNDQSTRINELSYVLYSVLTIIIFSQLYFIFISTYENVFWNTWQLKRIIFAKENLPGFFAIYAGLYENYIYTIFFIISFFILLMIIKSLKIKDYLRYNNNFYKLIILITFLELFFLTNIQWAIPYDYYNQGYEKLKLKANYNIKNDNALEDLNIAFAKKSTSIEKSGNNHYEGNTYYRNNKSFNINHINNWGNDNHVKLIKKYFNSNGTILSSVNTTTSNSIKIFFGLEDYPKRIFFTKKFNFNNINDFVINSNSDEKETNFEYKKIHYNGDNLKIKINTSSSGWVSFIDTWDHNWVVFVNGKKKKLNKLFGAYKSVEVQNGTSVIEFIYKPFNFNFKK